MSEKSERRRFTAAYKLQVLAEAGRSTKPGELGALLRREGLYSSHLAAWRGAQRLRADGRFDLSYPFCGRSNKYMSGEIAAPF